MKTVLKNFTVVIVLLLLSHSSHSQTLLDKTNWDLVMFDDFNYNNVTDLFNANYPGTTTKMWVDQYDWGKTIPSGTSNILFDRSMLQAAPGLQVVNGVAYYGLLKVNTISENGTYQGIPYYAKSGLIVTNKTEGCANGWLGGMFEVRCKIPHGTINQGSQGGITPAFWLMGGIEYDVFEINGVANQFHSTTHNICPWWCVNSTGGHCRTELNGSGSYKYSDGFSTYYKKLTPLNLDEEFHTWTFVWVTEASGRPAKTSWYFDGKEVRTNFNLFTLLPNPSIADPSVGTCSLGSGFVRSDCDGGTDLILGSGGQQGFTYPTNDPLMVDYIKVYKPKTANTAWVYQQHSKQSPDKNIVNKTPVVTNVAQSKISLNQTGGNIFYRDPQYRLWNYWYDGTNWQNGCVNWNITDVAEDITYLNGRIYYRSNQNKLKYFEWSGSSWANYNTTNIQDCAGFINTPNNSSIVYKSTDNNVWSAFIWNGSWTRSQITNTGYVKGGLICNSGGWLIYYRGLDNNLWKATWNGSWSTPIKLTFHGKVTDYITYDDANDKIYYIGSDGRVYLNYNNGNWDKPLSYENGDNNAAGEIALSADKKIVYYKGTDNRLWYYFPDNGELSGGITAGNNPKWYNTVLSWNMQPMSGPITVRWNDQIYYRDASGHMCEINWVAGELVKTLADRAGFLYGSDNLWSGAIENVYKTDETDMHATIESGSEVPALLTVYPNPTHNDFTFSIGVPFASSITLNIYDVSGKLLEVPLDNRSVETGMYSFKFETSNLANGVYYYNLFVGEKKYRGKLVKL